MGLSTEQLSHASNCYAGHLRELPACRQLHCSHLCVPAAAARCCHGQEPGAHLAVVLLLLSVVQLSHLQAQAADPASLSEH